MAHPIVFKPAPVDPHLELERRLRTAPREHAEALLVAYDVLQAAHDQGILDALHGLIGARDTVFAKIADYAKLPEGIAAIRNLLAGFKVFAAIDPEILDQLSRTVAGASAANKPGEKPLSIWAIGRSVMSEDGRRGLSFLTTVLTGFGRSLKR